MNTLKLASRDNDACMPTISKSSNYVECAKSDDDNNIPTNDQNQTKEDKNGELCDPSDITPKIIDDNELKLKKRIAQCKDIIESLKFELNEEKSKLGKERRTYQYQSEPPKCVSACQHESAVYMMKEDSPIASSIYSACVDSKLSCDESLIEYEKQLEKYQNTLNRAQIEKKNAIRKQLLTKAYKLKLLEVENQCNIELLRVKQSLQCLEPLQMIANKWKTHTDDVYDINNFELIPKYPELFTDSGSEISSFKEELDIKTTEKSENRIKDVSVSSDC